MTQHQTLEALAIVLLGELTSSSTKILPRSRKWRRFRAAAEYLCLDNKLASTFFSCGASDLLAFDSETMGFAAWVGRLTDFWEAAQVELHGFYSVERVQELMDYNARTSIPRALFVLALMPWPCVLITLLVDLIPLRPPSEGLQANYLFVVRIFLSFLVASIVVNLQFRHSLPSAPLSNLRLIVTSAIIAAETTAVLYALALVVGFPVPFGIITVSPVWVAFLLLPLASFLRRARADPELWPQVINSLKVWVSQEALVVIYPTYFYVFTTLSTKAKTPFTFLLPIIKMILRNVMSRTVVHLNDEIPEVVLMNVEVFNSLFMSYCMQNTPSLWTTLGLIAIDGAQMIASMHDVGLVIQRMQLVRDRVASERARLMLSNSAMTKVRGPHKVTTLRYTQCIFQRHGLVQPTVVASLRSAGPSSTAVLPFDAKMAKPSKGSTNSPAQPQPMTHPSLQKLFSVHHRDTISSKADIRTLELEYVLHVRKVLYITEFVILINYVEVIVPIIFCTFATVALEFLLA